MKKIPLAVFKTMLLALSCCLVGSLSNCATKFPAYNSVKNQIPSLQPGDARLYFYSHTPVTISNGDIFYKFSIDDKPGGKIQGFQAFYVDHPAGDVKVTLDSVGIWPGAPQKQLTLSLTPGETKYIQVTREPHVGTLRLRLIIMDPDQALPDLRQCWYVGQNMVGGPK